MMTVEVVTDKAVKKNVAALGEFAEALAQYYETAEECKHGSLLDLYKLQKADNRIKEITEALSKTTAELIAAHTQIKAVKS